MSFTHLFRRYLRDQGLPVTQQREAIAAVVFTSADHLPVEDIEPRPGDRGGRIGKPASYRTLEMRRRSGLDAAHDSRERCERHEHPYGQQPVREHLICTECGKVQEFASPELRRLQEPEARKRGFQPARYRLQIYGLCASCQAAGVELKWEGLSCPVLAD